MDTGTLAGINAVVLTVLLGGALAYAALLRQSLESDEARAFALADPIANLRGARLFGSETRQSLAQGTHPLEALSLLLRRPDDDSADAGRAILELLSAMLTQPPIGGEDGKLPVPASYGELAGWARHCRQTAVQAEIAVMVVEDRFRRATAAFEAAASDDFGRDYAGTAQSILDDLHEVVAIANRVLTQVRLTDQKRKRFPRRFWVGSIAVAWLTFTLGVLLPMVWTGAPRAMVAWEPAGFYSVVFAVAIVSSLRVRVL